MMKGLSCGLGAMLVVSVLVNAGCATKGQTGALAGGGIGALAGQVIGGSTEATLIGAAVGSGIGYIVGNEADKKHAREMSAQSKAHDYDHNEVGNLGGTKWKVVSINPKGYAGEYTSKIIEFTPSGHVITTTTYPDGRVQEAKESYRVVGNTLIVNKPGYIINARYSISGNQMVADAEDFSAVLTQMR
jgi:hypothetical protein